MVAIGGRQLRVAHLDKVLYPASGTTKAEVIEYCAAVAPHLLRLAADRPITRRRWPDGVAAGSFFEKNLPTWAPDWIRRVELPTSKEPIVFPVLGADDLAALVWLAAHSALELHTPQWTVDADGAILPPDRLVFDLDPGPGVGLAECARVALLVRDQLAEQGSAGPCGAVRQQGPAPVRPAAAALRPTGTRSPNGSGGWPKQVRAQAPDLVVVTMAKQARVGRVFLDWSQNRAAKTTLGAVVAARHGGAECGAADHLGRGGLGRPASGPGGRGAAPAVGGDGAAALVRSARQVAAAESDEPEHREQQREQRDPQRPP